LILNYASFNYNDVTSDIALDNNTNLQFSYDKEAPVAGRLEVPVT